MTDPQLVTKLETGSSRYLWVGVLTGPIAWALQLGSNWFMAEVVACAPYSPNPGRLADLPLTVFTALFDAVLFLATVGSGFVAWHCLRTIRRDGDPTIGRRAEWMARAGVINSITFAVVIAAVYVIVAILEGCTR